MTSSLQLVDVQCARGERVLFEPVSVVVAAGRMLRIEGANGSGKTTLLRSLCGLSAPCGGQVLWRGRAVGDWARDEFAAEALYIGHAPSLKDDLSALENIQSLGALSGYASSRADCLAALAEAGLRGRERLPARLLSQGQRKRVALARLCLHGPATLWILDEPFNALDDAASVWLQDRIHGHLRRGGVVALASHHARSWSVAPLQVPVTLQARRSMHAAAAAGELRMASVS